MAGKASSKGKGPHRRRLSVSPLILEQRRRFARRRLCLSCGHPFHSQGPWNRICSFCAPHNARKNGKRHRIPLEWPASVRQDLDRL